MSTLGDVLIKRAQVKRITDGALGAEPKPTDTVGVWGVKPSSLWSIFEKNNYFNVIESHFSNV